MRGDGVVRMRDDDETCAKTNITSKTTKTLRIAGTHPLDLLSCLLYPTPLLALAALPEHLMDRRIHKSRVSPACSGSICIIGVEVH
jgi:hypothetical protein